MGTKPAVSSVAPERQGGLNLAVQRRPNLGGKGSWEAVCVAVSSGMYQSSSPPGSAGWWDLKLVALLKAWRGRSHCCCWWHMWCCYVSDLPNHLLLQRFCLNSNQVRALAQERKKWQGLRLGWVVGEQRGDLGLCLLVAEKSNIRFNWWQNDRSVWTEAPGFPLRIFPSLLYWSSDSGGDAIGCFSQPDAAAAASAAAPWSDTEKESERKGGPLTFPLVMEVFVWKMRRHRRMHERREGTS